MWGRSLRYRSSTRCLSSGEDGVGSRRARRAHSTGIHTFKRAERRQRRAVRRITRCSGLAIRGRTGSDPSGRRTHFEPLPCGATRVERRVKIIRCGSMSNWPVRSDTLRPSTFGSRSGTTRVASRWCASRRVAIVPDVPGLHSHARWRRGRHGPALHRTSTQRSEAAAAASVSSFLRIPDMSPRLLVIFQVQ